MIGSHRNVLAAEAGRLLNFHACSSEIIFLEGIIESMTVCLQICHYVFTSLCVNWISSLFREKQLNQPLQIACCLVCLCSLERTPPATNQSRN